MESSTIVAYAATCIDLFSQFQSTTDAVICNATPFDHESCSYTQHILCPLSFIIPERGLHNVAQEARRGILSQCLGTPYVHSLRVESFPCQLTTGME